jgi:DNA repair protein RadC
VSEKKGHPALSFLKEGECMSENEDSLKSGVVPVYRIALVRESQIVEPASTPVRKASEAAKVLRQLLANLDREHFVALLLDAQHKPIGINIISVGSLTASIVHPREVFKAAILANAAAVIVAHNHPSGSVEPSAEDIGLTHRLREAGELLGIRVLDSIVLGEGESIYSFVDGGRW